jgi:hypothetical protein
MPAQAGISGDKGVLLPPEAPAFAGATAVQNPIPSEKTSPASCPATDGRLVST